MQLPNNVIEQQVGSNTLLHIDNEYASCKLSMHGAHLISFIPKKDKIERLWLSELTALDGSESIRGGIPICWPWFANQQPKGFEQLGAHGYARTQLWQLDNIVNTSDATQLTLTCPVTRQTGFSGEAELTLQVTVGNTLQVSLITKNVGDESFAITQALHSYFAVNHIDEIRLTGLHGVYLDKHQALAQLETPSPYTITDATDNIHLTVASDVSLEQITNTKQQVDRNIIMSGHDSVVVWNPWTDASNIGNMQDSAYRNFVCVEAANTQLTQVAPGTQHVLTQEIK